LESRSYPSVFPYELLWEADEKEPVTFERLAGNHAIYQARFDLLMRLGSQSPFIDDTILARLTDRLGLGEPRTASLTRDLFLVSGWFLEPVHLVELRGHRAAVRATLNSIRSSSRKLHAQLGKLPRMVSAALNCVRSIEPDSLDPDEELNTLTLGRTLHDLALAADRMVEDTARHSGRRSELVRDVALCLAAEAMERVTGERIRTSRAGAAKTAPYFAGAAGVVVRDLFRILNPRLSESGLANALETARRKKRI
jgi:hypothetical protein